MHPLFEYDLCGKNMIILDPKQCIHFLNMTSMAIFFCQNMTILDPKSRPKYDWYVKVKKINMIIYIHEKLYVCTDN